MEGEVGKEVLTGEVPPLSSMGFSTVTGGGSLIARNKDYGGYGLGRRAASLKVRNRA